MGIRFAVGLLSLAVVALPAAPGWAWSDVTSGASAETGLGAHFAGGGLHFGVYAPDAEVVGLLLFDNEAAPEPRQVIPLQKNGDVWRARIAGAEAKPGLPYLYR